MKTSNYIVRDATAPDGAAAYALAWYFGAEPRRIFGEDVINSIHGYVQRKNSTQRMFVVRDPKHDNVLLGFVCVRARLSGEAVINILCV